LGHGAFSAVWLAEDLSRVPLTLVSKRSVRDLRRRVSGRDKERKEKEREKDVERFKSGEETMQDDQIEYPQDRASPKGVTKFLERPPRKLRDGLKSILSLSRLPKLAPTSSCTDVPLSKSPLDMDPSSWSTHDVLSPVSLLSPQDIDPDMDSSSISRTSSMHSSSSYASISGEGARQSNLKLPSPGVMRSDPSSLSRDSSLRKFRDRVRGTKPAYRLGRAYLDERHGEMGWKEGGVEGEDEKEGGHGHLGPNLYRHSSLRSNTVNNGTNGRLVAVKMTPRKVRGAKGRRERAEEERTRVGFVREVEVLKVSWILFRFL
jgi:hypothetical protein